MSHTEMTLPTATVHSKHDSRQVGWRRLLLIGALVALVGGVWWADQTELLDNLLGSRTTTTSTIITAPAAQSAVVQQQATTNDTAPTARTVVEGGATVNAMETTAVAESAAVPATEATRSAMAAADTTATRRSLITVAGIEGAQLWSAEGTLLTTLDIGAKLKATARTADGQWLTVETAQGAGWALAAQVIAFDLEDLPVTSLVAPLSTAVAQPARSATTAENASEERVPLVAEMTLTAAAETTLADTPVANSAGAAVAAVVVTQGANLNVRSGAGVDYPLVTKIANRTQVMILGRDQSGDWLQVQLSSVADETGWVATTYLQLESSVDAVPVITIPTPTIL